MKMKTLKKCMRCILHGLPRRKVKGTLSLNSCLLQLREKGEVDYDSDDSWSEETMKSYTDEIQPARLPEAIERAQGEASTSGRDDRKLPQRIADAFQRADIGILSDEDKRTLVRAAGLQELDQTSLQPQNQKPMMWSVLYNLLFANYASCLADLCPSP